MVREQLVLRGLSAINVPVDCSPNRFPPKATGQPDQYDGAQEHTKNAKNT
jgi:hypothetical protein